MRLAGFFTGLFLLLLAAPASAQAVRLTIVETGEGIRIVYDLPRPTRALVIGGTEGAPPSRAIRLAEPSLAWRGGQIVSAAPFRRATLLIGPDDREADARYALLAPVPGRGFILYAPYVLPSSGRFEARVSIGGGRTRALPRGEALRGNIPVGAVPVAAGPVRLLVSTNMPAAPATSIRDRAETLLRFYAGRLHRRLGFSPLIVMSYVEHPASADQRGFRGDVTPNGVILLRFRGEAPDPGETGMRGRLTAFLAHELFHLWNGRRDDHPAAEAWLHEGSAEYYSWLAVAALWPSEISLERRLQDALGGCAAFLGQRPLAALDEEHAGLRYPCGALAQWFVDAGIRGASAARHSGFDLWARLVAPRRRDYSVADFRAAADSSAPGTASLLADFLDHGLDWARLGPALTAVGAGVTSTPPAPQGLGFAALRPIALSMCSEFFGVGLGGDGFYFNGICDGRMTNVYVVEVDGIAPAAAPERLYARVSEACAAGAELALVLRIGDVRRAQRLRCRVRAEAPVPDIRIVRALPLSPPARSGP